MKERYLKRILPALASAVLLLSPAWAEGTDPAVAIVAAAPAALPDITFFDKDGERALETGKVKLTVLHFWATWCVPCLKELPTLAAMRDAYAPRGVAVMPLALDGAERSKINSFYQAQGISFPYYSDHKMTASGRLKIGGLPTSLFINSKGEEIARATGPLDWNAPATRAFIEEALKAADAGGGAAAAGTQ